MNKTSIDDKSLVLLVEDNPVEQQIIRAVLVNAGFDVVVTDEGSNVLSLFQQKSPDLVLLDALLPDMDGFEVCRRLRSIEKGQYVPIVMLTGLDDEASIETAYRVGATDFYVKPLVNAIFLQRIRYLLRANRAFEDLRVHQESLASAQRVAGLGYWHMSASTQKVVASDAFCDLLCIDKPSSVRDWSDIVKCFVEDDQQRLLDALTLVVAYQNESKIDVRLHAHKGVERIIEMTLAPDLSAGDGADRLIGIGMDVTERKRSEREILRSAFSDALTELPNRVYLRHVMDKCIGSAHVAGQCVTLLYIDLDLFSRINNSMGHHVGDFILKHVAERLVRKVRPRSMDQILDDVMVSIDFAASHEGDLVVRLDGDTFVLMLLNADSAAIAALTEDVMASLSIPFIYRGQQIFVTSSIGVAQSDSGSMSSDTLLQQADLAVHEAKFRGRNQIAEYRRDLVVAETSRLFIQNDMRKALTRLELELYYQPKLNVKTNRLVGYETLVRWKHPTKGMISPEHFIPVAEETGLIVDLGMWVLREACVQHQQWLSKGIIAGRVAVNISGRQLREDSFIEELLHVLHDTGLPPTALELEITESVLISDTLASERIAELRQKGITIALDDFGTGYSALSYLSKYPVDVLKIDRSFVTGLPQSTDNSAIIEMVAMLSHRLNLTVVAEGVESQLEYDAVVGFGCDIVQGYLVSKPLSVSDCERWLSDRIVN